jgi:hypothetical protein
MKVTELEVTAPLGQLATAWSTTVIPHDVL